MRDKKSILMVGGARLPAFTLGADLEYGPFSVFHEDLSTAIVPRIVRQSPDVVMMCTGRLNHEDIDLCAEIRARYTQNAGVTVTRDNLCRVLFETEYNGIDRAIDVSISRIRRKLSDNPRNPAYVKTVRGVGYLFTGG